MAGITCADFGAVSVAGSRFCLMPAGGAYAGLVTYQDGRAAILRTGAAEPVFQSYDGSVWQTLSPQGIDLEINRRMQRAEIGYCEAFNNAQSTYSLLPSVFRNQPVEWDENSLREIHRLIGQRPGLSGNAFLCSNRENFSQLAINIDRSRAINLRAAISNMEADRGSLDELHYQTLLESLRIAAGTPNTDRGHSWFEYALLGIFAYPIVKDGIQWLINRGKDPKDPPDDKGGGGGGNVDIPAIVAAAVGAALAARPATDVGGTPVQAPENVSSRSASNSNLWLTAGGLLAAGATLFFLRRAGGREAEVREGEGRLEVRDLAGRIETPAVRPVARETGAANGGFNVFDLMGAQPAF